MKLTLEYKKARKEGLVASQPSMARAHPRSHELDHLPPEFSGAIRRGMHEKAAGKLEAILFGG